MNAQEAINDIAANAVQDIIKAGKWTPSKETEKAEAEAVKIQHNIIEGKGQLIDFKEVVEKWKKKGMK